MRAERVRADGAHPGQGPHRAEGDRRDREPAPHPEARERERGGGHHRQIDVERPVIRPLRGDEKRRDIGADEAEARQRRPMQQRGGKRRQRHQAEQDESRAGREKAVERMGGVDVGIGDGGAGGGQDARDVRGRQAGEAGEPLAPARPFAGGDERGRQQCAERDPHGRSEQALLDRVAYEKDAAERERNAADPDRPLRAETLLEAHAGCRDRRRCGWAAQRARMRRLPARVRSARPAPARWGRRRVPPAVWRSDARSARSPPLSVQSAAVRGRSAAAPPRSIAASRASMRRNCWPSPTDFTSATMAMTGNASSNSTSTTKNRSMKITGHQCHDSNEATRGTKAR